MISNINNKNLFFKFLFCCIIFLVSGFRSFSLGYDTSTYSDTLVSRWTDFPVSSPDILWNFFTISYAKLFSNSEVSIRFYLICISFIQSILFFFFIKDKSFKYLLFIVGFIPLIFFDILRQGTAMLFSTFFITRGNIIFFTLSLLIHYSTFISIIVPKINRKIFLFLAFICLIIIFLNFEPIITRVTWYLDGNKGDKTFIYTIHLFMRNYIDYREFIYEFCNHLSLLNFLVLSFLYFGYRIKKISPLVFIFTCIIYTSSIFFPLFFRFYFMYIFFITIYYLDEWLKPKNKIDYLFLILYFIYTLSFIRKTNVYSYLEMYFLL